MKIKTILIHFFLLLPTNIQLQQPLHCYAEFRALQNNRIENLKSISKTYFESTWQGSNGTSNYSAANQSHPSAWWKLTMIVKYVHSFYGICLLLYLHSSMAATTTITTIITAHQCKQAQWQAWNAYCVYAVCIDGNWDLCYFIILHLHMYV